MLRVPVFLVVVMILGLALAEHAARDNVKAARARGSAAWAAIGSGGGLVPGVSS